MDKLERGITKIIHLQEEILDRIIDFLDSIEEMDRGDEELIRLIEMAQKLHRIVYNQFARMMDINIDQNTSTIHNIPEMKRITSRRARIQFQLYRINNHIIYLLNKLKGDKSNNETSEEDKQQNYDYLNTT